MTTLTTPSTVTGALQFNNDSLTNVRTTAIDTWTTSTPQTNDWGDIVWSSELGIFVSVSFSGTNRVSTSVDGITWLTANSSEQNIWVAVAWSPELGIFVSVANTGGAGTKQVMYSSNGTSWATANATQANTWTDVVWSTELGIFVAVSYNGTNRVMYSPNGVTWETANAAQANQWESVIWSPELGIFVALSSSGTNRIMTSSNGIDWNTANAAQANGWVSIAWSPKLSRFAAISYNGGNRRAMYSSNGTSWTTSIAVEDTSWSDITWSPQLEVFIAVASSGTIRTMYSTDGITWLTTSLPNSNVYTCITWSPSLSLFVTMTKTSGANRAIHSDNDFSSFIETTYMGTQAVTDVSVLGNNINIGESVAVVNIGKYASELTLGSPGTRITSMGNFMGISTLWDEKAASTSGGNSLAGAWYIRFLNNIRNYGQINCVLTPGTFTASSPASTTSYFTLSKGTYFICSNVPSMRSNQMQIRLRNTTASKTLGLGSTGFSTAASNYGGNEYSLMDDVFEIIDGEEDDSLSIEFRTDSTGGLGYGWGGGNNWGNNIFTQVFIYKIY